MVGMCSWFRKNKNIKKQNNYKRNEFGDIEIKTKKYLWSPIENDTVISASSVVAHTENSIICKNYKKYYNFQHAYSDFPVFSESIEQKKNLIRYLKTSIVTYEYDNKNEIWNLINIDCAFSEVMSDKTPLDVFKTHYKSNYKLIETEEELNEYLASTLDCNTWCRRKLYNKMKELGLCNGFINQFADLIGNDLTKYHAMIELAEEISDKDTLMYLYTYKFGKK